LTGDNLIRRQTFEAVKTAWIVGFRGIRRRPSSRPAAIVVVCLIGLAALVCSCTGSQARQQTQQTNDAGGRRGRGAGEGPVPVTTASSVQKAVPVTITAVGAAESISTVQVRSQVTGRLSDVHFSEGQEVEAGQPLFTLDPQPFQVVLDQANAILQRDTAQATNAQAQADRYKTLFDKGLVPREQYETQLTSANALKATMAADDAAIAAARLNLQYSKISAPVSGRTGALLAHKGDLIQANGSTPLVVVNQLAPIYVAFSVPGKFLDEIRRAQRATPLKVTARVTGSDTDEAGPETGRLTFIDNAVDPQTGTIKLKGTFANADRSLWPGEFLDVALVLRTEPNAIVVPSVAVQASQQGPYVFVVDGEQKAQMRPVTVSQIEGDESVIASGLRAGEVVVTDGQLRLVPGARVANRAPARGSASGEAP
jgi:multidrug efflux system membrane fusion protein